MSCSTSLSLLCEGGEPADLLLTFDGSSLDTRVTQLRFYLSPADTETEMLGSYTEGGVRGRGEGEYDVDVSDDERGAHMFMPIGKWRDRKRFKHFAIYTVDERGHYRTGSTLRNDRDKWDLEHTCGGGRPGGVKAALSNTTGLLAGAGLPKGVQHAVRSHGRRGLIIGLSAGLGSLLLLLVGLGVWCCRSRARGHPSPAAWRRGGTAGGDRRGSYYPTHKDDEFDVTGGAGGGGAAARPPKKVESVTTAYLKSYYDKLRAVKEEHDADSDGDVRAVGADEIIA